MGYLSNFIVYFCAMIGIIILALWIYQKFNINAAGIKSNHSLKIEDTLGLSARKTLYVIRSGNERFLIAADMERTALISKLEDGQEIENTVSSSYMDNGRVLRTQRRVDLSERNISRQDNVEPIRKPIMKEIKNKLKF